MGLLSVILAAVAGYAFGAVWYMVLAKPWIAASGVETGEDGKPKTGAATYALSFIAILIVAGMMRHIFALGAVEGAGKGLVAGLGLGLFIASPWIVVNYAFAGKPRNLTLIDGGYATVGCAIIGLVLTLI